MSTDRDQERHQPADVDEDGAEPECRLRQRRPHAQRLGAEGDERGVLEHERHAEHQEDLHLVRRVDDAVDEPALDDHPQDEERRRHSANPR